jgi:hypothetical protein
MLIVAHYDFVAAIRSIVLNDWEMCPADLLEKMLEIFRRMPFRWDCVCADNNLPVALSIVSQHMPGARVHLSNSPSSRSYVLTGTAIQHVTAPRAG